jgi:predicted DNA-binding transcriptional regulator AlpA
MRYLRFRDLQKMGVVANRVTLGRWIESNGFPPGVLLGPNSRAWPEEEVLAWLASRRSEREAVVPPRAA